MTGTVTVVGSLGAGTDGHGGGDTIFEKSVTANSKPVTTAANTETYKVVPDCTDSTGNHINYTQSTDAWSCGTSVPANTVTTVGVQSVSNKTVSDTLPVKRLKTNQGTSYAAADTAIVLSAGWGNTATVSNAAGSFDQALHFSVTANGTGIATAPSIAVTFKDGTFTAVPTFVCGRVDNAVPNQPTGLFWAETATTLTITPVITPTAGNVYSFRCVGLGN